MSVFLKIFMRKASKKSKFLSKKFDQDVLPADRPSWGLALKHDRPFRFPNELYAVENLIASLYKDSHNDKACFNVLM